MEERNVVYSTFEQQEKAYQETREEIEFEEKMAYMYDNPKHYNWEIDPRDSESDWEEY